MFTWNGAVALKPVPMTTAPVAAEAGALASCPMTMDSMALVSERAPIAIARSAVSVVCEEQPMAMVSPRWARAPLWLAAHSPPMAMAPKSFRPLAMRGLPARALVPMAMPQSASCCTRASAPMAMPSGVEKRVVSSPTCAACPMAMPRSARRRTIA